MADVYVCKETAAFEYNGDMVVVHKDVTRVRAGHPILDAHPELFQEITVHFDVERATAAPGEKRSLSTPTLERKTEPEPAEDDLDVLRQQAQDLDVKVDKRWGPAKLRREIEAAGKDES